MNNFECNPEKIQKMNSIYKLFIVLPFRFVLLLALVGGGLWSTDMVKNVSEVKTTNGSKHSTITAEEVKRILEVNGASQIVTVETDSTFTTLNTKQLLGFRLQFLDKEEKHQLKEVRTWKIKAGCNHFELEEADTATLLIGKPVITSREHMVEQYTVVKRVGVWNPVVLKTMEIQSRNEATTQAIAEGILTEARFSIENSLRDNLPKPLKIRWK